MHKAISITLNGTIFYVEEQAYNTLEQWLEQIKAHFVQDENAAEIISDIEIRVAEQLTATISKAKEVITIVDIERIISEMGSVQDFTEIDMQQSAADEPTKTTAKRLYRDPKDKMVAGVASGIATYFGIDPVWVRLLFVISIFFGGTGVIAYLILWLVIPEAKTASQQLEMHGSPVTLQHLEKSIKKNLTKADKKAITKVISFPFVILGQVIAALKKVAGKITPILRVIIGVITVIGSLVGFIAISLLLTILLFNTNPQNYDRVLASFAQDPVFPLLTWCLYIAAAIPLLTLLLGGVSIIRKKNTFSIPIVTLLIGSWIVAFVFSGALVFDSIPKVEALVAAENNHGPEITKTFDNTDFNYVTVSRDAHNVTIEQGEAFAIQVTGEEQNVEELKIEQYGDRLSFERKDRYLCIFGCHTKPLHIEVTMPEFRGLHLRSASTAEINDFTATSTATFAEIIASGASKVTAQIDTRELDVTTYSASQVTLTGAGETLNVDATGASRIDAANFPVTKAVVKATGAAGIEVYATEILNVEANSGSHISYYGEPELTRSISSSSRIKQIDIPEAIGPLDNLE